jgi:methylthioribose-1-phosphate isomerase
MAHRRPLRAQCDLKDMDATLTPEDSPASPEFTRRRTNLAAGVISDASLTGCVAAPIRRYNPPMLETIAWTGNAVRLVDQTRLPLETAYVEITDERQMWDAIKRLVVRGAPAIGVAAAFGVYLGVRHDTSDSLADFDQRLNEVCAFLATSRPTAVNLFWAIDRQKRVSQETRKQGSRSEDQMVAKIKQRLLAEALTMLEEDKQICRQIGQHGLALLKELSAPRPSSILHPPSSPAPLSVLTHCNAGSLATVAYGTALAPVYLAHEQGLPIQVFADETRPLLQGSRITAYELREAGVPVTVICDNMAAAVMSQGKVQAVIVGTDRVAANGDVANKIGTLNVAILAKHFDVPFLVAAPTSSIDLALATGKQIPIEERDPSEISNGLGRQTAPDAVDFYNPAFDVTPSDLVTAIITEHGVARPPYADSLKRLCR